MDKISGSARTVRFQNSKAPNGSNIPTSNHASSNYRARSSSCDRLRGSLIPRLRSSSVDRYQPSPAYRQQLISATPHKKSYAGVPRASLSVFLGKGRGSVLDMKRAMKDPRPLSDRSYQNQCVQRLFEFLQDNNYPNPITIKLLICPSKKDFLQIFQFLYSWWVPKYAVSQKCDEDIPKIMKSLLYPFTINKSILMTVGSRHSFPTILGVLMWLMEINQYMDSLDLSSFFCSGNEFELNQKHKMFFELTSESYSQFISTGIEDNEKKECFLRDLAVQCHGRIDDIEELAKEEDLLEKELENIEKQVEVMLNVKECNRNAEIDINLCDKYIQNMTLHMSQKEAELMQLQQEHKEKRDELNVLKAKKEKLEQDCQNQEFDAHEIQQYFSHQKQKLTQEIEQKLNVMEDLKKEAWDTEISISQNADKLAKKCWEFNKLYLQLLNLVPECLAKLKTLDLVGAKKIIENFNISLLEFEIEPNPNLLALSYWSENVEPCLLEAKVVIRETVQSLEKLLNVEEQSIHDLFLKKKDLDCRHELMDIKIKQKNTEIQNKRVEMDTVINSLQCELRRLDEDINNINKSENRYDQEAEAELQSLGNQVKQQEQENIEFYEQGEKFLSEFFVIAQQRVMDIEKRKKKLTDEVAEVLKFQF